MTNSIFIVNAHIRAIAELNENVCFVELVLPQPISRLPGQYCELLINDEAYAYSIASSPVDDDIVELHIRFEISNPNSIIVMDYLNNHQTVDIRLPMGDCVLTEVPNQPLLLIAGSTGYSGIQSLLLWLMDQKLTHDVWLYWGGRGVNDLYGHEDLSHFIANSAKQGFRYYPVISGEKQDDVVHNNFRQGLLHDVILEDARQNRFDLTQCRAIIAGSPAMVYGVYDALVDAGLPKNAVLSDVFAYAPRDEK